MSGTFQVVSPREFPVRLGNLTFYAAGWKLSGTRQYAQQGGVQGAGYVTNTSCRVRQLVPKNRRSRRSKANSVRSRMAESNALSRVTAETEGGNT